MLRRQTPFAMVIDCESCGSMNPYIWAFAYRQTENGCAIPWSLFTGVT